MVYRDNHDQRCTRAIAQRLDEQGSSIATIARTLDVSTRTVKRWRSEAYREEQPQGRPVEFEQTCIASNDPATPGVNTIAPHEAVRV